MASLPMPTSGDNVADVVLGEMDLLHNGINDTNASSLDSPGQMAVDLSAGRTADHLYVVDTGNSRILAWNNAAAFTTGAPADLEIGQPDFETTTCNSGGVSAGSLCLPGGVAVDAAGDLWVADTLNSRVLEYATPFSQGKSTGFAAFFATGQGGSFTQTGCATTASGLCDPQSIALDSSGNLYVADAGNNRVLWYDVGDGELTAQLVFGQGASGADFTDNICDISGGNPASAVGMCNPLSVVLDSSRNLFVGDDGNHRVLEFNEPVSVPNNVAANLVFGQGPSGTVFTTSSCNAASDTGLCNLSGIALDGAGDLFVADITHSRVLEFPTPIASGQVTATVVFGQNNNFNTSACGGGTSGTAPSASVLCQPDGVTVDSLNDVFIADAPNNRVLSFDNPQSSPPVANRALGEIDLAHNGIDNPTAAALQAPQGVAVDLSGTTDAIYVADTANNRVLGWDDAGFFASGEPATLVIGQPDAESINCNDGVAGGDVNGLGPDSLCGPTDLAVDNSGNLYVADATDNRVLEYLVPFAIDSPMVGLSASQVWGQIGSFTTDGCNLGDNIISAASLCFPAGVAVDTQTPADLYISDTNNSRILEFNSGDTIADNVFGQTGSFTTKNCNNAGLINADALCGPRGLVADPLGDLFVADSTNSRVLEYLSPLVGGPGTPGTPGSPGDTTADLVIGQGSTGTSFATAVCSTSENGICNPIGVSLDALGDLFVGDQSNNRVLEYNQPLAPANVTATEVFGQGTDETDFSDSFCFNAATGNPAVSATGMCGPSGVAVDAAGNLYVADTINNRVLQFDQPIVPTTTPTPTASATPTATATETTTATATATPTDTATATATATQTATSTATATATSTATATQDCKQTQRHQHRDYNCNVDRNQHRNCDGYTDCNRN